MRRSPEVLIARLRNKKSRIIASGIFTVVLLGLLAWYWFLLITTCQSLVPREGENLAFHVVFTQQLLVGIAFIQCISLFLALGVGLSIGMLINELSGFTKNDLLVQLWDRVQALERSQPADPQSPTPNP
jgi:hypothetical protein